MESNNRHVPNHLQSTNRPSQYKDPPRQDLNRSAMWTTLSSGKRPTPSPPNSPPPHRLSKCHLEHYSLSRPVIQYQQDNHISWADYDEDMEYPPEEFKNTHHHPQHPTMDPGLTHQEAMEELGLALDKAIYVLKAISVHANFPTDFIDKAMSIYEKVTGSSHNWSHPTVDLNQDIVSALTKLTQEVAELKCLHTNQPPPTTQRTSRLIIQPISPPPPDQHFSGKEIVNIINSSLKHKTKASVVVVKWNDKGNCIIIAHPSFTAKDLLPFNEDIAKSLLDHQALDRWSTRPNKK
ncbi:hypothetical protein EDD16DRAFT_1707366 [Pisolithus croceorrhizus]|nr:hypothetical protein EDD16DRAFT_1707366 [Pisolithus croceorrhizus]KAI6154511.1 hypothetical protein EDD17DRAFT_1764778 [Pisolithus thermaeus]